MNYKSVVGTDRHDPDAEYEVAEKEQADWQSVGQELQVLGLLAVGDEGAAQEAGVDQLHVPVLAGGHHLGLVVAVHQQGPHQGQQQRRAWGENIFISQTSNNISANQWGSTFEKNIAFASEFVISIHCIWTE